MISYLKGTILEKGLTYIILENGGIGYKIFVTPETLQVPAGYNVALFTYHKVSDDGQSLFGLTDFNTLQFFELLITVSGVGPKVALAILSAARVDAVRQAIANQDAGVFTRISRAAIRPPLTSRPKPTPSSQFQAVCQAQTPHSEPSLMA